MPGAAQRAREASRAALAGVPVALDELTLHADLTLEIESLDAEGRGVARNEGKVIFVEGALPGERVAVQVVEKGPRFDVGRTVSVERAAGSRVTPPCPSFGLCGGCALQHAETRTQVAAKQRRLEDNLVRIGKVEPGAMLPPVYGESWGYRGRARLSVRRVRKKGGVLVGFRERRSTYVADMRECHVLAPQASALIGPLREMVEQLSVRARLPQVEIAVADNAIALVFRHLDALTAEDCDVLAAFSSYHGVNIWLQPAGPETVQPLHPAGDELYYEMPEFGLRMHFRPTEFTQVNQGVNRLLVSRAVRMLDVQPGERIADLYCGLGNFSLPMARLGAQVIGFEGSSELIARARANAAANGLTAQFEVMNLSKPNLAPYGRFDKILLDPPREGAMELVKSLGESWPRRIVYVSCDPATLARDAGVLVHVKGFRLDAAGIVNMFPHTAHVESIALFQR